MQLVIVLAVDKDVEWKCHQRLQVYYKQELRNILVAAEVTVKDNLDYRHYLTAKLQGSKVADNLGSLLVIDVAHFICV